MAHSSPERGTDPVSLVKPARDRTKPFYLSLIVLLGAGLRIHHLGYQSIWEDETFTRYFAESPLSYLWTTGFRLETNPPLYNTIMHFWMQVFGTSESGLRSFSVLASVLAIILVYVLGKELESPLMGLVGAAILALSPLVIAYAQEARSYALLQATIAVALIGIARYLSASRPRNGLTLYALGASLSVYCHDTALFFIFACNMAVLSAAWWSKAFLTLTDVRRWLLTNVIIALVVSPVIINAFHQRDSANILWIKPPTWKGLQWITTDFVLGPQANDEWHHGRFLAFLVLGAIGYFLWKRHTLDLRGMVVLVLTPLLFAMAIVLISFDRPILCTRVLVWAWIPLSLLLAHVLIHARARLPFLLLIALLLGSALYTQVFPKLNPYGDWRTLIQKNQEDFLKADSIIMTRAIAGSCITYYLPATAGHVGYWSDPESEQRKNVSEIFFHDKFGVNRTTTPALQDEIRAGKRVCFIYSVGEIKNCQPLLDTLPRPDRTFGGDSLDFNQLIMVSWGKP